ncbi:ABC transporter permease [Bifidobacterium longum]|uniref:ABC transporter permease n=1 Tax=Bifidobacterium longum TaxID=216816 RepID=UPI0004000659|nr:ABC transporter permease [Bifidobacterium longum]
MTPKAPKAGRRILLEHIGPLWRRMSFSWKVSARNILRYKRRFLMTVIGVSGCTALMLVGFGLHDAIWDIIDVQFGQIQRYDMTVSIARGPDAWERLAQGADGWDTDLAYGTWYATAPAGQEACDRLADALRADRAVATVGYVQTTVGMYRTMLSAIDVIVVVLIVAAAALAFIVLYDLTTIDIGERIREIATLKVLGFRRGEVDAYVFREVAVLVLVGALAGLGLGTWLEGFVITTVEVDVVMFGRTIHAASYLWAFLLAGLFAAVVMLAMRPRLAAIDMVESLKSVD